MKKKFLSFLLLAVCALFGAQAWADVTTAAAFKTAFEAGGTVTLGDNITDNTAWDDPMAALYTAGADVTINLNGHTLTFSGEAVGMNGVLGLGGHTVTLTGNGTIDVTNIGDGNAYVFFKDDNGGSITITPGDGNTIKVKTEKNGVYNPTYGIGFDGGDAMSAFYTSSLSQNTTDYNYSYDSDNFYIVESKKAAAVTVAKIGDTPFTTLQAALNAVTSGQTIDMAANVETHDFLEQSALYTAPATTFTLNMNGHKIMNTNPSATSYSGISFLFSVPAGANMTIKGEGVLMNTFQTGSYIADVAGSLAFEDCDDLEVSCSSDNVFTGSGTISITSGKYNKSVSSYVASTYSEAYDGSTWYVVSLKPVCSIGSTNYTSLVDAIYEAEANATIKLLDNITLTEDDDSFYGIDYNPSTGEQTEQYASISIYSNSVILDLNSYTLQLSDAHVGIDTYEDLTLTVIDGSDTQTGKFLFGNNDMKVSNTSGLITTSGTFNYDVKAYCPAAYTTKEVNGEYKVILAPVCSISTTEYATLAAAVSVATSGQTITLLKDNSENVTLPAGVSISLNGFSYTGTASVSANCVKETTATTISARLRTASDTGNKASVAEDGVTYYYTTLEDALTEANASTATAVTVTLLDNYAYTANESAPWNIKRSMTFDGGNKTLSGWGKRMSGSNLGSYPTLLVNWNGESLVDVTIQNVKIINNCTSSSNNRYVRPIETRGNIHTLTIDNVDIDAKQGTAQGIAISNSGQPRSTVLIKNSKVDVGDNGYAFLTFNPVDMTINNTQAIGFGALYFKSGSTSSIVTIENGSELTGDNTANGGQNFFGVIICEDGGLTVNATNSTFKALAPSTNVTNSIFCNSSANYYSDDNHKSADNVFNIGDGCKVNLSTKMRYFVIDDAYNYMYNGNELHSNAIVNLLAGSMYNFIPVDKYVYNSEAAVVYYTSEGSWDFEKSYDYSKPSHVACQDGYAVINNTNADAEDYPYIIGAAPKYDLTEYKGVVTPVGDDDAKVPTWEDVVAAQPNSIGIMDGTMAESDYDRFIANVAFAKSTDNVVVKYDDDTYICPNLTLNDLSTWGLDASGNPQASSAAKTDYYAPHEFTATNGSYTRLYKKGYNSACFPFDIVASDYGDIEKKPFGENEVLTFSSFNENAGTVYFKYANADKANAKGVVVSAGTPIIIKLSEAREITFDLAKRVISTGTLQGQSYKGVYMTTSEYGPTSTTGTYYSVDSEGGFSPLADKIYPFRACFRLSGDSPAYNNNQNAAPRLVILDEQQANDATGLDAINAEGQNEKFLQNNKLFIRHNGQVFDAKGQLVK